MHNAQNLSLWDVQLNDLSIKSLKTLQFYIIVHSNETFEKCSFLPAQLNPYLIFNRGSRKAKILTTGIH